MNDRCDLLCLDLEVAEGLRRSRLESARAYEASRRARALSEPTRLQLAVALSAADELCVCDLAWIAERSQNLISHHLKILRSTNLVRSRREGKMVVYRLTVEGRTLLEAFVFSRTAVQE